MTRPGPSPASLVPALPGYPASTFVNQPLRPQLFPPRTPTLAILTSQGRKCRPGEVYQGKEGLEERKMERCRMSLQMCSVVVWGVAAESFRDQGKMD